MSKGKLKIGSSHDARSIRIWIDGTLHLFVRKAELVAVHAWREKRKANPYKIDLLLKNAEPATLEYNSEEKWRRVLAVLDQALGAPTK